MPLGGNKEVTGSHKGYGYGMICELFSSILSMGVTSDQCCTFPDKTGICHGFMAIDPAAFGDPQAIRRHFSEYLEALRESPKAEGKDRIYTHGEKEVLAEAHKIGLGAQFGGKYLAHDVRIIRLPRHGASCPVGLGVSCSADRNIKCKINDSG